ncbi:MAG: cobalt ECF transporter T component CbiQ [Spirulinaceae cyanobacterium RM2_2_10]|nr:cobalt ECF transporter T component CbiQ [Spirulinaceae cyanobacterium RM2_2_10]
MRHLIDSLAYTNRLRTLPPSQKVGWAIALICLSLVAPIGIQVAITLWLSVWVVGYARIPAQVYLKLTAIPLSFLLMSVPALVLSVSWQPEVIPTDAQLGFIIGQLYLYLSQAGVAQAIALLARAIATTTCLYFLLLTVPLADILRLLSRVGCPELLVELLLLMYRAISVLSETAEQLIDAQKARSGFSSWRRAWRSVSLIASQLLWRSLTNYRQLTLGLTARGYNGRLRFWHPERYQSQPRYWLEAIVGYAILLALTGWHYAHRI